MATTLGFVALSLLALFGACTLHGCDGGEDGGISVESSNAANSPSTSSPSTSQSTVIGAFYSMNSFSVSGVSDLQAFCGSLKASQFPVWTLYGIADGTCQPIIDPNRNEGRAHWGAVMTASADMRTLTMRGACPSDVQNYRNCIGTDSTCATATGPPQLVQLDADKFVVSSCERQGGSASDQVSVTAVKLVEGNFEIKVTGTFAPFDNAALADTETSTTSTTSTSANQSAR